MLVAGFAVERLLVAGQPFVVVQLRLAQQVAYIACYCHPT